MKRLLAAAAAGTLVTLVPASAAAGGGGCHGGYTSEARGAAVTLQNFCMDPLVIRVAKGGTVTWTNTDDAPHNVLGAARQWGDYETLGIGESVSWRFDKDGTFPYACTIHPGMVGAVVSGSGVLLPGTFPTSAPATRVTSVGKKSSKAAAAPAPRKAAIETQAALPASSEAAAAPPAQQPPAQQPPAAAPAVAKVAAVRPIAATPVSRSTPEPNTLMLSVFAIGGALVLAAVAFAARRTPPATRELVG